MTTILALLTDISPTDARGGAVGLYRTFMDIGGFLGPLVFMFAYTEYSRFTPFYIGSVINFLNIGLIIMAKTRSVS
jgi:MFS family permease